MEINVEQLKRQLESSPLPLLVEFWASWCAPCQMMAPLLGELAPQYKDKINIFKINVDRNPQAAGIFQITTVPTIILFNHGQEIKREMGAKSKLQLEQLINIF